MTATAHAAAIATRTISPIQVVGIVGDGTTEVIPMTGNKADRNERRNMFASQSERRDAINLVGFRRLRRKSSGAADSHSIRAAFRIVPAVPGQVSVAHRIL